MYKPEDMALPASFRIGNRTLPPHAAALLAERDDGTRKADGPAAFAVNEQETREAIALTYGMIAMIDDGMAKILNRLDELGLARKHRHRVHQRPRRPDGRPPAHAQGRLRLSGLDPRAVHLGRAGYGGGARAAARSASLSGTLDIAATFLDRARLAPYNGIQGKSLLPAIAGNTGAGHDGILIEYGSQRPVAGVAGRVDDAHAGR